MKKPQDKVHDLGPAEKGVIHIHLGLKYCTQINRETHHLWDKRQQQTKQFQHLPASELSLPWWKEVSELLCGLPSATLNSSPSNSHITWTQNHLVWLLAPAGLYHNATEEGEV